MIKSLVMIIFSQFSKIWKRQGNVPIFSLKSCRLSGCVMMVVVQMVKQNIQIFLTQWMTKEIIFELIHKLQNSRRRQTYFASIMYITNLVIHIIIYLSIPSLSMISIASIMNNIAIILVLGGLTLILILQLLIYLLKKLQIYLFHQLSIYRFIISPLLAYTILEISKNGAIPQPVALIAFIINKIFSSMLSRAVLYENHRNYTLNILDSSIIFQFDTFQILLISNCFIIDSTQIIFVGLTLASALLTTYKHFLRMESHQIQYKILHFANITHVVLISFCLERVIFFSSQTEHIFAAIIPLLLLIFFAVKNKMKSVENNITKLLAGELPFEEFVEAVDCFLLLTKHDSSADRKRKLINYIFAIISHHKTKCMMPHCQLENPSTQEELKNITSKSLLQLTHKIFKKIQWIFEGYRSKSSDDVFLAFIFLKFYSEYLQNKAKMQNLLNEIHQYKLSWAYELELSKYKQVCINIQNIDSIDVIKDEEIYIQFQNAMVATLNCMIEFWSEFSQEKVDLGKIMSISVKLFPFKARVEQIFFEQIKIQKFTTFKILKLYSQYLLKILNKFELASKVEDIQIILANLLKDKQDIQYLSKESEAGFIVICLSQSKLGDIFMVNQKACEIFRYTKKEMLSLRVNAIMPSVFADIHDQILIGFLKKKRKKYNTDQRMLFGKDGNGYIFPVELQLQRASFSSNDEYIFIASVSHERLRAAPVYCIVDQEGEITDFTASFRNLFFKNSPKKSLNRNIQEIIPNYFDTDYAQKSTNIRRFTHCISIKKLGEIEAKFQVIPLIVKTVHEGYLIKISYNNEKTVSGYHNTCFTQNLKQLLLKKQAKCMENNYNQLLNAYEISGRACNISLRSNGPQFTLPFLSYQDMAIFATSTEVKSYGKDVKTIRLVHNHFERIDQEQSFHSQQFANDEKIDVRAKIEELKHKFNKKQDQSIILIFKILINIIIFLSIIIGLFAYTVYLNQSVQEKQFLRSFDNQKKILYYLPQYIISFTCANAGINKQYFTNHLLDIQPILISNIQQSTIDQVYKDQMMKIVYLKSPILLIELLNTNTFQLAQSDPSINSLFQMMWGIMVAICILFFFTFIIMFYYFNQILFSIYTLFLALKQSSIKKIEESCKALIEKIYFQSQQNVEKEQQKKAIQDEEEQNEIQKIKQFKNMTRKQDLINFLKLTIPLVFISAFSLIMLFESNAQFQLYQTMKKQHNTMFESIPTSSIEIAKIILKVIDSIALNVDNPYEKYYQELQMTILQFNQNSKISNFMDTLYGNICTNSNVIQPNMVLSCNTLGNGILTNGIQSTINFIADQLKDIKAKNAITTSNIELIFALQFQFINPVLLEIEDSMQNILVNNIQKFCSFFSSMVLLVICFYIIYDAYLLAYPLNSIETEIKLTNQMISLMPDNAGQDNDQQLPTQL